LRYVYKNFVYNNQDNKGTLYKDGKILFMGNSWSGIMQFLSETNNAPEVREMFKAQLEQREKIKYKLAQKEKVVDDPNKIKQNWSNEKPKKSVTKRPNQWDKLIK